MADRLNPRNPAVKRILQELKEVGTSADNDFIAEALEDDLFEWHFVIKGPQDTEFEGGVYHGRILLPPEYPFKPPAFMMLTPSGRFQTGVKICLSISSHHPEQWQPSWSVRTALTALIAFMPTPGNGALGSLDYTQDERRALAAKSRTDVPHFGSPARQRVTDDMHRRFLEKLRAPRAGPSSQPPQHPEDKAQDPQPPAAPPAAAQEAARAEPLATPHAERAAATEQGRAQEPAHQLRRRAAAATAPVAWAAAPQPTPQEVAARLQASAAAPNTNLDRCLTVLAVVLLLAIAALVMKKLAVAMGYRLTGVMLS